MKNLSAVSCRDKIAYDDRAFYLSDGKVWKPCKPKNNCYTKSFCDDTQSVKGQNIYTLIGQLIVALSVKPGFLRELYLVVESGKIIIKIDFTEYFVCFADEKSDDSRDDDKSRDSSRDYKINCVLVKSLQELKDKLSKLLEKQIIYKVYTDSDSAPIVFDVTTVEQQMIYFPSMLKSTSKSIAEELDKAFKEFGYRSVNTVADLAWLSSQMTPTNKELTVESAAFHKESIIGTDNLLIFLIKRLDNQTYNVEYDEGSEKVTLSKNALRKFLSDLNIQEISVTPISSDIVFHTFSCVDCYAKDLAPTKNDFKSRCTNDFDVLSSNSKSEFKDPETILFDINGKWECFDKATLIQYWGQKEPGNSWNYGRCRFVDAKSFDSFGNIVDMPTLVNGDPKRDCQRFYKIPTESRGTYYISHESADRVDDTLGYTKWRLLPLEKVQMGANLHTIGEFNAKDIQVYRLVPVL